MKRIFLSVAALLAFTLCNAQDNKTTLSKDIPSISFGVKGGLNIANVTNNDDGKSLFSFHAGAYVKIPVSVRFAIQPEVLYSAQGVKYDDFCYHLNYINVPVMARFYASPKFSIEAGPQVGIMTTGKITDGDNSVDIKDLFNTTDFGFNLGFVYDVNDKVSLGIRYYSGLTDLIEELDPGVENSKNSVFQFSLSYKL